MIAPAFFPEAEDDIAAAHAHYEERRMGLGDEFTQALRDVVDRLRTLPHTYGVVWRDIRAAPLKRFPYVVFYRARENAVLIIAVQHGRRSYRVWRRRI